MADLREITAGTGFQAGSPSVTLDRWTYRGITLVQPGTPNQNLQSIIDRPTRGGVIWMRMDYTGGDTASAEEAIVRMMNGNAFPDAIEDFYITFRNTSGNVIETTNNTVAGDQVTGTIGYSYGTFGQNRHPSFRIAPWSRVGSTGMWMVVNNINIGTTGFGGNVQTYSRFIQYGQGLGNAGLDLHAGVIDDPTDGYTNFVFTLPTNVRDRLSVDGEEPTDANDMDNGVLYKSGLYLERFATQTAEDNDRSNDQVLAVNQNGEVVLAPADSNDTFVTGFHTFYNVANSAPNSNGTAFITLLRNQGQANIDIPIPDYIPDYLKRDIAIGVDGGETNPFANEDSQFQNGAPSDIGTAGQVLAVNTAGTALEFTTPSTDIDVFGRTTDNLNSHEVTSAALNRLSFDPDHFILSEGTAGQITVVSSAGTPGTINVLNVPETGSRSQVGTNVDQLAFGTALTARQDGGSATDVVIDFVYPLGNRNAAGTTTPVTGRTTLQVQEPLQVTALASGVGRLEVGNAIPRIHTHQQNPAATQWVIAHGLNSQYPVITVYDGNEQVVIPMNVTASVAQGGVNTITVEFPVAVEGTATLIG